MAVPKRKTQFQVMRRSHLKSNVNIVEIKSGEYRLSHHVDLKYTVRNFRYLI